VHHYSQPRWWRSLGLPRRDYNPELGQQLETDLPGDGGVGLWPQCMESTCAMDSKVKDRNLTQVV
jgi:hypothetical protein